MKVTRFHSNRHHYNWLSYEIIEQFLVDHIPLYRGVIYDLGCGEAPYKEFFLKYASQYVGVDWAESYHNTKADIVADLNVPLPIEDEIVDTVISISVLEHLREPQNMLNEAFRILKPGGRIILQVPWQWWVHEAPYDYFRFTPYAFKYMLEKIGFVDVSVEPTAGFFSTIILKCNYFSTRFIRGPKPLRWIIQIFLLPFWYVGQWTAPLLDKFDRNWSLEAGGYNVTARKP